MWVFHQDDRRQARQLPGSSVSCRLSSKPAKLKQLKGSAEAKPALRVLLQCSVAAKQGTLPRPARNQHILIFFLKSAIRFEPSGIHNNH